MRISDELTQLQGYPALMDENFQNQINMMAKIQEQGQTANSMSRPDPSMGSHGVDRSRELSPVKRPTSLRSQSMRHVK